MTMTFPVCGGHQRKSGAGSIDDALLLLLCLHSILLADGAGALVVVVVVAALGGLGGAAIGAVGATSESIPQYRAPCLQ